MVKKKIIRPKGYEGLLETLAAHMGINIVQCRDELGLSDDAVQRLMGRCGSCGESWDCTMKLRLAGKGNMTPPSYCSNRKILEALQQRMLKVKTEAEKAKRPL